MSYDTQIQVDQLVDLVDKLLKSSQLETLAYVLRRVNVRNAQVEVICALLGSSKIIRTELPEWDDLLSRFALHLQDIEYPDRSKLIGVLLS